MKKGFEKKNSSCLKLSGKKTIHQSINLDFQKLQVIPQINSKKTYFQVFLQQTISPVGCNIQRYYRNNQ